MQVSTELKNGWVQHQRQRSCSFRTMVSVGLVSHKPDGIPWHQTHFLPLWANLEAG